MFKTRKGRVVISVAVSVFVLLYLIFQLHNVLSKNITTEFALSYEFDDKISADAYIIRDEEVVSAQTSGGVIGYCQQSGSKVQAESTIAEIFSAEQQAAAKNRIIVIDKTLERLESLQTSNRQVNAGAEFLDSKIQKNISDMLSLTDTGNLRGYAEFADELLENMEKKQMAVGGSTGFESEIAALTSEKQSLESSVGSPTGIVCQNAGYFVNGVDGYEGRLSSSDIAGLSVERLVQELSAEPQKQESAVGKVIVGNEWYIAANISTAVAKRLVVGNQISAFLPGVTSERLLCTVAAVNPDYSSDQSMVALKCDRMSFELTGVRCEKVEICVGSYSGLKISSGAVRVSDGVTGVYVLSGINAVFKPIEILYSDSNYVICKNDVQSSSGIRMYDEVILGGSDLYDGKTVK